MKFYKIQMLGRFLSEYVANVTALTYSASLDKGRILYDETTNKLYFGDNSGGGQFNPIGGSIPSTEIILFEKNTAVSGYTLLTSVDDETVFISKGAGSAIGPGATSVGSWATLTGHTHPGPSHRHTGPSHRHTGPNHRHTIGTHTHGITAPGTISSGTGMIHETGSSTYIPTTGWTADASTGDTGYDGTGDTGYEGTGVTGYEGTGATDASAAIATWRPAGRIFTRQQRI
jgi:hypothetical protein